MTRAKSGDPGAVGGQGTLTRQGQNKLFRSAVCKLQVVEDAA